ALGREREGARRRARAGQRRGARGVRARAAGGLQAPALDRAGRGPPPHAVGEGPQARAARAVPLSDRIVSRETGYMRVTSTPEVRRRIPPSRLIEGGTYAERVRGCTGHPAATTSAERPAALRGRRSGRGAAGRRGCDLRVNRDLRSEQGRHGVP